MAYPIIESLDRQRAWVICDYLTTVAVSRFHQRPVEFAQNLRVKCMACGLNSARDIRFPTRLCLDVVAPCSLPTSLIFTNLLFPSLI